MSIKLSNFFTLEELTSSDTALRKGIDNTPDTEQIKYLTRLAYKLDQIRALLGNRPIHVNSGYRCSELNAAIGGAKTSAHMEGRAADIVCPDFGTPKDIAMLLQQKIQELDLDQVIQEGTWLHVAIARSGETPRQEFLTANFKDGVATYSKGL